MERLVGWREKRRRCHTLVACPIASPSVEKWRLEHPHDTPPYRLTPSPTFVHSSDDALAFPKCLPLAIKASVPTRAETEDNPNDRSWYKIYAKS